MKSIALSIFAGAFFVSAPIAQADNPVIVHEWGTFTSLQDEHGQAIGGINVDDESVPNFVYRGGKLGDIVPLRQDFGLPPYRLVEQESAPIYHGNPDVTMRLETPVLYIYPPKGHAPESVPSLDVHVDFNCGYLSQYYPKAKATPVSAKTKLSELTVTSLDWKGVRIGSKEKPVVTDDKVWTAPRETSAPLLEVHPKMKDVNGVVHDDAQVEHFLFYRGVGHLDSPLRLQDGNGSVGVWPQQNSDNVEYAESWMTEIRPDGSCAFREQDSMSSLNASSRPEPMKVVSGKFAVDDFSAGNMSKLRASMQAALVKAGLYDDEATAMLKTWELSYFKSPGLRFFYIVPREWTDKILPLKITGAPTEITRVMMGRIELISDSEKATLARLAAGPCPDLNAVRRAAFSAFDKSNLTFAQQRPFLSGERPLTELGISLPPLVQDYLSLGRFRDALIVHKQQQHPSPALAQFISNNQLIVQ